MIISYIPKSLDELAFIYDNMNVYFPVPFTSVTHFTEASQRHIDKTPLMAFNKSGVLIILWDRIKETSEHEDTLDNFYEKFIELKLISIL